MLPYVLEVFQRNSRSFKSPFNQLLKNRHSSLRTNICPNIDSLRNSFLQTPNSFLFVVLQSYPRSIAFAIVSVRQSDLLCDLHFSLVCLVQFLGFQTPIQALEKPDKLIPSFHSFRPPFNGGKVWLIKYFSWLLLVKLQGFHRAVDIYPDQGECLFHMLTFVFTKREKLAPGQRDPTLQNLKISRLSK